ncbi:MAG: efflux RND transporter permease subunit, partial [Spirochaetota bacterium]
ITEIELNIDSKKLYYYNLNLSQVIRYLRYIFYSPVIMKYYQDGKVVDVRGNISLEGLSVQELSNLAVPNIYSQFVALGEFALIDHIKNPAVISRKNTKRYISLDIRYKEVKKERLLKKIHSCISRLDLGGDFYYQLGKNPLQKETKIITFAFIAGLAVFLVYVVCGIVLRGFVSALIVIFCILSAGVGSFIFLWVQEAGRSVPVYAAVVILIGFLVHTPVILLDELSRLQKTLRKKPGCPAGSDTCSEYCTKYQKTRCAQTLPLEKLVYYSYERKHKVMIISLIAALAGLIPVFFTVTSTGFFKVFTGVLSSGLVLGTGLSMVFFPGIWMLLIKNKRCHSSKKFRKLEEKQ